MTTSTHFFFKDRTLKGYFMNEGLLKYVLKGFHFTEKEMTASSVCFVLCDMTVLYGPTALQTISSSATNDGRKKKHNGKQVTARRHQQVCVWGGG